MTEQSKETHFNEDQNAQLAAEWLTQLQKQGRVRLWISAGLFAGLLVSSGALYTTHMKAETQSLTLTEQSHQIEGLKQSVSDSAARVARLTSELKKSEKTRTFLEQIKGDTASQLNVAEQIIDTQKQKISLLEVQFSDSINTVAALERQLKGVQQQSAKLTQELAKSNKELSQRSIAYQALVERQSDTRAEVDRLAKALEIEVGAKDAARHALVSSKKELSKANRELNILNGELAKLRSEHLASSSDKAGKKNAAQDHHALAIQPIVGQVSKEPQVKVLQSKPGVVDPNSLMIQ